ncbi:MAG TPA: DMT family transporter [Terriglobia bacterium]|jgi:drug/metabolite transporter (DMT)-like permease|nr:DMT family transporter [Terriglobia bacterium]
MRSWLLLFACNLMWALQFTCVKLVQDQVGALFTVWGPMTLATIMLIPLITRGKRESYRNSERSKRDLFTFFLLALVGIFPGQVFITWGTRWSLASNAALLMLTLPVSTALLAYILLGERMTRVRWISFALAIAGVLMCSNLHFEHMDFGKGFLLGNALIFGGTLGSAFYNSYSKKVLERYSPLEVLFYTYVGMFIIMTPLVICEEGSVFGHILSFTAKTWVGLALLTFFHNFLSMVLFLTALKHLDAIQAALSNYLITFFGIPIAVIWLGERLAPLAIVGGVIILGSTLLITVWDKQEAVEETPGTETPIVE